MENKKIAKLLYNMAGLLELAQENRFKIRAYISAAQTMENITKEVIDLPEEHLIKIQGIGKGIASKIVQYKKYGKIFEYETLKKKFPEGLLKVMTIQGMGPKRARFLFDNLKIDNPDKLKVAARKGKLRDLPGFGIKLEQKILKGTGISDELSKRILFWEAKIIMEGLLEKVLSIQEIIEFSPAGSFRRGKETVGDLDILCTAKKAEAVTNKFSKLPGIEHILGCGKTKASVILSEGIQCDLRVVEPRSFGAALMYFTGSKEHNVALRERAIRLGYSINEYGLFRLSDKKKTRPVAGVSEEGMFKKLGLQYIPPELRENRSEITAASKNRLPKLVEEKDIMGDLHNHTNLSDGVDSMEDMVKAAIERGWKWIAFGDHSQSLKIANGLSVAQVKRKMKEIEKLNKKYHPFRIMSGSEVDINLDATLDYPQEILKKLDFVIASIHTGFNQSEEEITKRILEAIHNPDVDCIAHLTGRLLGRREPYAVNIENVLRECAKYGKSLEINGQPDRHYR